LEELFNFFAMMSDISLFTYGTGCLVFRLDDFVTLMAASLLLPFPVLAATAAAFVVALVLFSPSEALVDGDPAAAAAAVDDREALVDTGDEPTPPGPPDTIGAADADGRTEPMDPVEARPLGVSFTILN
jgi:hypothetical protein